MATTDTVLQDKQLNATGLIRQIGEEARNLRRAYLKSVNASVPSGDEKVEQTVLDALWKDTRKVFDKNRPQINDLFTAVTVDIDASPAMRAWVGQEITRLANFWESIQSRHETWTLSKKAPTSNTLKESIADLDDLIYEVGLATVPTRLEAHLRSYRPGQLLSFDAEFEDELPDPERRKKVLQYLYDHPTSVSGIVDVDAGTVLAISPKASRRRLSWLVSLVIAAVVVGACAALGKWNGPGLRKEVDGGDLAAATSLVLLGMVAHVLVGALKDLRRAATDQRRRFASAGNWLLWGHAKELDIWAAIIFAGVLAYIFAGARNQTEALTLLTVGYSGDSFVDILLPKFEKGVVDRTEKAKAVVA